MGKYRKRNPPAGQTPSPLPPPPPLANRGLSFSFRYFTNRPPFEVARGAPGYPLTLLERLRDLGGLTAQELRTSRHPTLRCHPILWSDTTEPTGFAHLNSTLRTQVVPYQFSLSSNEHGRVHGFFIGDVFYVVWLDPDHQLYSR